MLIERIGHFVTRHTGLAWLCVLAGVLAVAATAASIAHQTWQDNRLAQLQISADRQAHEIMSQTISGALMGAITLTGLTDDDIKSEGMNRIDPNTPTIRRLSEPIGHAFHAEGVFVVSSDGIIRASWNGSDKPTTGLNVRFRPYFQVAMKGLGNIYAAVRLSREDRALYFAAPIYPDTAKSGQSVGAIVARASLKRVDDILNSSAHIALLLSPQGIIFAGNRLEWIGRLVVDPTPERLRAIRELKQFGDIFEARNPIPLTIPTQSGFGHFEGVDYAASATRIQWNDPSGDWQLLLLADLSQAFPKARILSVALISGAISATLALLLMTLLRSLHRQSLANGQVREFATALEIHAEQKERIASLSLRLQQTQDLQELGQILLSEAHLLLGLQQGVIYLLADDDSGGLQRVASYACATPPPERLVPGEGLLGQCALDQQAITLSTGETTQWPLRSGLGEAPPNCVTIRPILLNQKCIGVIEMALDQAPDERQQAALDAILPVLAMNLEINRQNRRSEKRHADSASAARDNERSEELRQFRQQQIDDAQRILALRSEINALALAAGQPRPYPDTEPPA